MPAPNVSPAVKLPNTSTCPRCGAALRCAMVAGDSECWCFAMPRVIPVPGADAASTVSCLCAACLQHMIDTHDLRPATD